MQETIIKSSVTTIQNGVARADGKLYVTENSINFDPYNKKLGLGPYELKRRDVSKVGKCLGKGGGIVPVTSDAIQITLVDGSEYQFILSNPKEWLSLLSN